jgi:pilus assembly protein CpaC
MKSMVNFTHRIATVSVVIILMITPGAKALEASHGIAGLEVHADSNSIELATQGSIEYGYFPLSDPDRLVFDFPETRMIVDNGATVSRRVQASLFDMVRLSQFSLDPPIARLVIYLTSPASANIDYNADNGRMIIRIDPPGTSSDIEPTSYENKTTDLPAPGYEIIPSDDEVLLRFKGMDAGDIDVNRLSFPDRLHVRLFTMGPIGDETIRFDALERGNIWNGIAKQWASFKDRNGLGVIDLTVYLYPETGFSQSIDSDGTPEVSISKLPAWAANAEVPTAAPSFQVAVESYPDENIQVPNAVDLFQAPPLAEPDTTQVPTETANEVEVYPDDLSATASNPPNPEPEPDLRPGSTTVIPAIETVDVVRGGTLLAAVPKVEETPTVDQERVTVEDSTQPAQVPKVEETPTVDQEQVAVEDANGPHTLAERTNLIEEETNPEVEPVYLKVGQVEVIPVERLVRASVGNPAVATLNVISQTELLVTALAPGTTTLLIWQGNRGRVELELRVLDATGAKEEEITQAIGDPDVTVRVIMSGNTPGVVLEGRVETEEEQARAGSIAALFVGAEKVSNLVEITQPRQVMVKVRVVEIDKRALDERLSHFSASARTDTDDFTLGIITDLLDPENPGGGLLDTRTRPGIVNGDAQDMVFDPIDAMLNQLETNREASILSEPNLISMSGHEAHFRVGGEVPYTFQNENGFNIVQFKEFGIELIMTPNVDSQGNIRLTLAPTVRTIDMALAVAGIPGFRTREMRTDVQLKTGETLVIGGLIQHEITKVVSEVPFLSQIPVLGELFKSKRFIDDETELVIFLTPYIVENPADSNAIVNIMPTPELTN